jgi:hypothetical protein
MPKIGPVRHPLSHEATRDTMWVGKGLGGLSWVLIVSVVAGACLVAWWLH